MLDQKLLPAEIVEPTDSHILNEELGRLERKITEKRRELRDYEGMVEVAAAKMRSLYIALHGFYGNTVADTQTNTATGAAPSVGWEKWKAKLGGKQAEIIQVLLDHGAMTRSQLRVATGSGMSTVDQCIYKLRDLGLVVRDGESWRLKG